MNTTITTPELDRFTKNDNPLIAFEAIVIVVLCVYIMILHCWQRQERKETNETNKRLADAVTILIETVRHVGK